jgi:hypothetical protein
MARVNILMLSADHQGGTMVDYATFESERLRATEVGLYIAPDPLGGDAQLIPWAHVLRLAGPNQTIRELGGVT